MEQRGSMGESLLRLSSGTLVAFKPDYTTDTRVLEDDKVFIFDIDKDEHIQRCIRS